MNFVKSVLIYLFLSLPVFAQEDTVNATPGYISDDLFIYTHSGPGNNYRIVGTINSGVEVTITGKQKNDYSEIINEQKKAVWVESKNVSTTPGLRHVVAQLNEKMAALSEKSTTIQVQASEKTSQILTLSEENLKLNNEVIELQKALANVKSKLKDEDTNIKKQWFFNGAIVLGLGLILGLVIPRIGGRKRSDMSSWK